MTYEIETIFYKWWDDLEADNGYRSLVYQTWRGLPVGRVERREDNCPYVAYVGDSKAGVEFYALENAMLHIEKSAAEERTWFQHITGGR